MNAAFQVKRPNHRPASLGIRALGRPLTGLAALALLGGLAAKPAAAQYLTVGANTTPPKGGTATVSGSGTTAAGTYEYDDANAHPAPLPPGTASYYQLDAVGPSTLTLETGGSTSFLNTYNGATAYILGGSAGLVANDFNSTITMSGGFADHLDTSNGSTSNVSGGSINALNVINGFASSGTGSGSAGIANVSGGTVGAVTTRDASVANLFGGALSQLNTTGTSTINLFGTGFTRTAQSGNTFLINGVLQNGTVLVNLEYNDYNPGQDHLNFNAPVPEASSALSLGLLLALGAGCLAVARRRRTPPAR